MKRINRNDLITYVYITFIALMCILAVVAIVGEIYLTFKVVTSNELPFWLKWVLITR
jgi:hypothetical protein